MRIVDLKINGYRANHRVPYSNGRYTYSSTEIVVCQILTDEGVTGIGWTHGDYIVISSMLKIRPWLIGLDPFRTEQIWSVMYQPKLLGRKGLETRAISAIDIALWDIKGKVCHKSIWHLLGGYRECVPAYIAGGYYEEGKSLSDLKQEIIENRAKHARFVKMKIGKLPIADDLRRVDAVLEVLGEDSFLMVDANNAYDRIEAVRMGKELDKRGIYWFEEPLIPDDIDGLKMLADKIDTPLAVGENEYTKWGFKDLIDSGAVGIINADAQVMGGITEWKKVADYAQAANVLIAPHGDQDIHAQLVGSIPNGLIVEYYDGNLNSMLQAFSDHLRINNDGMIEIPVEAEGLGVCFDDKTLEEYRFFPEK